jgi:MFS family permease
MPREIWALGFVSLFMDVASETVHGLLPVFLVSVLGASMTSIGALEGLSEAAALAVKVFSGPVSDWFGKRKPLVVTGYLMGALSKPIFAISNSVGIFYSARLFDRFGKGIRGAPRDALVADIAPPELRGKAFGLRQSLDTVGAFVGPALAIALMWLTQDNYRLIFWLATIPGLISVGILFFGVQEPEVRSSSGAAKRLRLQDFGKFNSAFWFVSIAGAVFQLARFSEAFLILRAKELGLALALSPLVLIVMNVVYALSAYPIGALSDRVKREWFLLLGLLILFIGDLILGFGDSLFSIFIGIILWGLHMGLTQGTLTALVADHCRPELRGTAYGLFNLLSAAALLIASLVAGLMWDEIGSRATFMVGAGFSLLSFIIYFLAIKKLGTENDIK